MNKKQLDKFITENRPVIDEFLGVNNPIYTAIALKGQILKLIPKQKAMEIFERLMKSGLTQNEQNNVLREILKDLRGEEI